MWGKGTVLPGITTVELDEIATKAFVKPAKLYYRPSKLWRSMGRSFVRSMIFTMNSKSDSGSVSFSGVMK